MSHLPKFVGNTEDLCIDFFFLFFPTEIHEKRLEDLKKQLDYLTETNWKYKTADALIGL